MFMYHLMKPCKFWIFHLSGFELTLFSRLSHLGRGYAPSFTLYLKILLCFPNDSSGKDENVNVFRQATDKLQSEIQISGRLID